MKTSSSIVLLALTLVAAFGQAVGTPTTQTGANQAAASSPVFKGTQPVLQKGTYQVTKRGPNQKVWQKTDYEIAADGRRLPHVHQFTELASGMNYLNNGEWVESKELIETYSSGAICRQGPYQVIFANNLNSAGAIDQQTPDGKRLRSSIIGLAYNDSSTGKSVLLGQIQDSQGELISANQVLYPNAFSGVNADIRYTYKRGSFEQDVILREQPATPESFGLNSQTTEIEVLTEFIDPPQASIVEHQSNNRDLPDDDIGWGAMRIGHGKAFDLGEKPNAKSRISVRRQYMNVQGRNILVEGVPLTKIQPSLSNLPLQSSAATKLPALAAKTLVLPKTPMAQAKVQPMKLASASPSNKGFVLDYMELNTDQTNFTFQGDMMYLLDGNVNLTGTTTFEGNTVIKADPYCEINIDSSGSVNCQTGPYRPAIFTSINDDSVGESGAYTGDPYYTGTPGLGGGGTFLDLSCSNAVLRYVRFSYAVTAVQVDSQSGLDVWDSQFVNIINCFSLPQEGCYLNLHNVLIYEPEDSCPIDLFNGYLTCENVTCDGCGPDGGGMFGGAAGSALSNVLITGPDWSGGTYVSFDNDSWSDVSGPVYQTVGAGSYYLTNGSPYRNVGTTNISPALLAEIRNKTTYPPIVFTGTTISTATNFSPQAIRDTSTLLDIGFHYDPLDYVFGGVEAQANITFTAGTAVGWYDLTWGAGYGIIEDNGVTVAFNGTVTSPCWLARYDTSQEGGNGNFYTVGWGFAITSNNSFDGYTPDAPQMVAKFSKFSSRNFNDAIFRDYIGYFIFRASDCEFWDTGGGGYDVSLDYTNCLFFRVPPGMESWRTNSSFTMKDCSVIGGNFNSLGIIHDSSSTWPVLITDCAFDGTTFYMDDYSGGNTNITFCDYNAFLTNANLTATLGGHEITNLISFNWQSSWLGDYYLPPGSPLINAGGITADKVALYHFTTQTNQVPETNSIVDIGYHYVATDAYGNPLDSNDDGIPDYLEDANGNGLVDSGEIGWNIVGDLGLKVIITKPQNDSALP